MLTLLTACGGGSDSSGSNLLVGSGANNKTDNTGGGTSTTPTTSQATDITVMGGAQELIPSGGRSTISFVTYKKFDPTQPNPQMITIPGVTFKMSVTGAAVLENVPQQSNKDGEIIFTVSHPGNENVMVTIQGTGQYVGGFIIPLYFGASVTSKVITEGKVPADGKTPANIAVFARDWAGMGISGVPVDLSFSGNSFAVPTQAVSGTGATTTTQTSSTTGADGQFTIGITNTVAQTIKVTPFAGGMPAAPLTLVFDTTVVAVKPASLDLLIKTDNVLADGKAQVILVVVARDPAGTPVPNIPISLTSDSATALLKIGDTTGTLFIKGNTGPVGSFELAITDTVEETVTINASTSSGDATATITPKTVQVKFTKQTANGGVMVDKIELDPAINNKQPANGKDIVTVRGRVLDKAANPIANQKISVIVSGGSAKVTLGLETTDSSGRFFASFTDEVVEEFIVKAVVGDISSNPVSVSFIAIPPAAGEAPPIPPQFITLLASPSKQTVDDGTGKNTISLIASVRDGNGTPMAGVKVRVAATSNSAVFDVGTQETNNGGTAIFKVSNTIAGSFSVTATAWVEDRKGQVVGTPISSSQTVSFYTTATTVIAVSQLTVRALNDKQPASTAGDKPIKLEVVALDSRGRAIKDAPIIVQMASSVAIASPPNGKTDDKGYFSTNITSTEAGTVPVTVAVEGTATTSSLTITFIAVEVTGGEVKPESVKLEILNDSQPADGTSKVTLIVTPKDVKGTPMAGVDITLISNSDTAKLASNSGKTNALGEFRTTVTDSVAETITVTAVATNNNTAKDTKAITFIPAGSGVTDLLVNIVNNNAPATGKDTDAVELDIIARDAKGRPVAGAPISVQLNKGSPAVVHSDKQVTDNNGLFVTKITSTVAGETTVTVAIEGTKVVHAPVVINFKPPAVAVTPTTIKASSLPTNATQPADGKTEIILVVIPRDAQQGIIPGVSVELISDSRTAVINTSPTTTNALGEARFAVTDTVVETFKVTPVTAGVVGAPLTLTFTTIPPIDSKVQDLVATVVKNNQPATGEDKDAAVISVVARDEHGQALADVPITVQLPKDSVAVAKFDKDVTDKSGLFVANIVSTVVGDIEVKVGVKGTDLKRTVKVTFKPAVTPNTVPTTVDTQVIPNDFKQIADGQSGISVIVIPKDAQGIAMPGVKVEFISDSTTAKIDPASVTTNALGEARFTVTSATPQTVTLIPVVGEGVVDKTKPPVVLTFLPLDNSKNKTIIPNVVNNNQPATGKAENAIQVDVVVRDQTGKTLPDIPLVILLPAGAIATPIEGTTAKENGVFSTKITSTKAGDVVFQVGIKDSNYSVPVTVTFVAEKQSISPTTVEIVPPQNASQPADGTSTIILTVIPRSQDGTPIPDVAIELVSDPNQLKIDSGKTNALGQYQVVIKSDVNVVGTFAITPVAAKDTTTAAKITGKPVSITFTPLPPVGLQVADLTVTPVNDKQPADGKAEIQIDVVARDSGGRPVADVPIVVQLPTSSAAVAKSAIDPPKTDKNGYFSTKITSTIAGEVAVTIGIKDTNIAHAPVIVTFVPPAGGVTPTTVELLVLNAPQPADGKATITLEVTPRDAKGLPMANVDVTLIHDSNTAKVEKESGTTNAVGVFRTTITDSVAETVNVTPVAAKGAVIGQKVPVTFIPVAIPIPATITLTVDYESGDTGQQVGKSAILTVFAYDDKHAPLNAVPVTLVTLPGDDPPDVSSTAKFDEAAGAQGKTGKADGTGNGTFITKISNSQSGTFKVVAKVTGTSLSSNTVKVSFAAGASTAPEVSDISLISNYPQLGTDNKNTDKTEGVTITAILKDKDNNLVKGAIVRFSADSGEVRAIATKDSTAQAGVTDDSGRAQALLTTSANRNNRVVTVTAQVSTAKGEVKTATIPIKVVGTNIKVTGENTLIMGGKSELTITLADNGNIGIANEILKVESPLGNTLSNPAPVTDANGQTKVTVTATVPGQDVITVSKDGATSGTLTINISDQDFTLVPVPATADLQKIPLNTPQEFLVRWKKGGVPQALQQINLSATRGKLPASVTTDINGEAHFTITADNAGPTQIKATAAGSGGPSQQINANFIATKVVKMTLQADPSTIGVNAPGAGPDVKLEQSTIIAVLRDDANNLVEGKTVSFTLTDNTGGSLSPTASVTDQFGQASTKYTAGTSSSASNGVAVVATVEGRPTIDCAGGETNSTKDGCIVKLTVALKRAFISLGSGNQIIIRDESTYQYPYKVLATDINGAPIPNTEIIISVWPLGYLKGFYQATQADSKGQGGGWAALVTAPDLSKNPPYCINEDVNQNGVLDPGEDRNHNNRLDPGGIATFAPGTESVVTGNTMKVKTGNDGYASIDILYTKDMANWVIVVLTARTLVSGSEDRASVTITLTGAVDDFKDPKKSPPGRVYPGLGPGSPFGSGPVVVDNSKTPPVVTAPNATCDNDL
jgi:adhesin/invasin